MKALVITVLLIVLAPAAQAGCVASILQGNHSALLVTDAQEGAREDALELCYPGQGELIDLQCQEMDPPQFDADIQVEGKITRCVQTVSCTLCSDNLLRRHQAGD